MRLIKFDCPSKDGLKSLEMWVPLDKLHGIAFYEGGASMRILGYERDVLITNESARAAIELINEEGNPLAEALESIAEDLSLIDYRIFKALEDGVPVREKYSR